MSVKIFVGNIPYNCEKDMFDNCFKDVPGFIECNIIKRFGTDESRGFGFVVLDEKYVDDLLKRDIRIMGRELRFSIYEKNKIEKDKIFIKTNKKSTPEEIIERFSKYDKIVQTKLMIKDNKTFGLIHLGTIDGYNDVMNDKRMLLQEGIEVHPFNENRKQMRSTLPIQLNQSTQPNTWFNKQTDRPDKVDKPPQRFMDPVRRDSEARNVYQEGYKAGYLIGFQQGEKAALQKVETKMNNDTDTVTVTVTGAK